MMMNAWQFFKDTSAAGGQLPPTNSEQHCCFHGNWMLQHQECSLVGAVFWLPP